MAEIHLLTPQDAPVLDHLAPGVFDRPVDPQWCAEFFADPRHHLAVALEAGVVVGIASAVHYLHPDKPPELWINEVGVAPGHRGAGVGRRLVAALLDHGRALGCVQAWVLTDESNVPAQRMYAHAGGKPAPVLSLMFEFALDPDTRSPAGPITR